MTIIGLNKGAAESARWEAYKRRLIRRGDLVDVMPTDPQALIYWLADKMRVNDSRWQEPPRRMAS